MPKSMIPLLLLFLVLASAPSAFAQEPEPESTPALASEATDAGLQDTSTPAADTAAEEGSIAAPAPAQESAPGPGPATAPAPNRNPNRTPNQPANLPVGIRGLHHWGYFEIESSPPLGGNLAALQDGDPNTRIPAAFGRPLQIAFTKTPNIAATEIKLHFAALTTPQAGDYTVVGKVARRVPRRSSVLLGTVQPRPNEDFLHFQFPRAIPLDSLILQLQVLPRTAPIPSGEETAPAAEDPRTGQSSPVEWADLEIAGPRTTVAIKVQPAGLLNLQVEPPTWIVPEGTPLRVTTWQIDSTGNLSIMPLPGPVGFSSNNASVLNIMPNGRLNALKPGSASILGVLSGPQMLHDRMNISVPAGLPLGADLEIAWLAANPEDAGKELRTWQVAVVNHGPHKSGRIRVEWSYAGPQEEDFRIFEVAHIHSMNPGLHILEPKLGDPLLPTPGQTLSTRFPVPALAGGRIQVRLLDLEQDDPIVFNNTVIALGEGQTVGLGLSPLAFALLNGICRRPVHQQAIDECPPEFPFSAFEWARLLIPPLSGYQAIPEQGANATPTGPPAPKIAPGIAWSPSGVQLMAGSHAGLMSSEPVFLGHIPEPITPQQEWLTPNQPPIVIEENATLSALGPFYFFPPRN